MLFKQSEKVAIFGHDDGLCFVCRKIDFIVTRISQSKIAYSLGLNLKVIAKPVR